MEAKRFITFTWRGGGIFVLFVCFCSVLHAISSSFISRTEMAKKLEKFKVEEEARIGKEREMLKAKKSEKNIGLDKQVMAEFVVIKITLVTGKN